MLGHVGFFDRWAVTFNAYKDFFVVEKPDDFESRLPADIEAEFPRFDSEWSPPR